MIFFHLQFFFIELILLMQKEEKVFGKQFWMEIKKKKREKERTKTFISTVITPHYEIWKLNNKNIMEIDSTATVAQNNLVITLRQKIFLWKWKSDSSSILMRLTYYFLNKLELVKLLSVLSPTDSVVWYWKFTRVPIGIHIWFRCERSSRVVKKRWRVK